MKKEVTLKFKNGSYELIYSENGYSESIGWAKLMSELFGGWEYNPEEKVLTVNLKYGNNTVQKDYDLEFNPKEILFMEYNTKINKEIKKLFKKLQEDYLEFIQEMKDLEFEEEIFSIEY